MVTIQDLQLLIQILDYNLLQAVHYKLLVLVLVVAAVMRQATGHGILATVVQVPILWAEPLITKVILAEAEWYKYHGFKDFKRKIKWLMLILPMNIEFPTNNL
jgi:hypothetical protein